MQINMFKLKKMECQFLLLTFQKSISSFPSSDSLDSEGSDSSSSSAGNINVGRAVGIDGVVSFLAAGGD
jgi:hypothetical protein